MRSLALALLLACIGCKPTTAAPPAPAPTTAPAPPAPVASAAPVHDPAHPPIDCPLRKAGIATHDLKPFAETEQYIAFLERADREIWQKPDEVVRALGLRGDETVADVGAGSGYFTFRLAAALPKGRVVALDLEAEMLRHIHHKAMSAGVTNVQVAPAAADDPKVPEGTDLVFVCDVLHHVADRAGWMKRLAAELKPGARLVLVEFREGDLPQGPPASLKVTRKELTEAAQAAGFALQREDSTLLPYQYLLVFQRT